VTVANVYNHDGKGQPLLLSCVRGRVISYPQLYSQIIQNAEIIIASS